MKNEKEPKKVKSKTDVKMPMSTKNKSWGARHREGVKKSK